jgi:CRP/FNR family transcriptional regulator
MRDRTLCQALPDAAIAQLNQIARRRRVHAGSRLFEPDSEPVMVANVVSGVVRISNSLADGRTQIVGLQFPGEFVGRPFATESTVLAEAATDVELCCYTQRQFESLVATYGGMKELFLKRTIEQLDEAREWMLLLGRKTAEERVASLILLCAEKMQPPDCAGGSERSQRIDLPLSRTEMADFLGLTLETVGRMIRRLQESGAVTVHPGRGITINDVASLRRHAEKEQP